MERRSKGKEIDMSERGSGSPGDWALTLANENGVQRQSARETLVAMGREATPILIRLLSDPHPTVRWEAALALKDIEDPSAGEALAEALMDESGDVRWVAAEALAAIGREGLRPLLKILVEDADSFELREAAHVAISLLREAGNREILAGVYQALKNGNPPDVVMMEAAGAMDALEGRAEAGA
jgi:hypothetical protein